MTDLPDGNPKTPFGLAKPGLTNIPFGPLFEVGRVMEYGAAKYGPMNWRDQPVTESTYINAALRHIMAGWDGPTLDPETRLSHYAHAVADLLIVLDAAAAGTLHRDGPTLHNTTHRYINTLTEENPNVTDSSNPSPTADACPNLAEWQLPSAGACAEQPTGGR